RACGLRWRAAMSERALIEQLDQAIDAMLAGGEQTVHADPTLSGLLEIAGSLRDLPDERFKVRLGRQLLDQIGFQRRTPVTVSTPIEPIAREFAAIHAITPFICGPDGNKLLEFMKHTFDAEEKGRHPHGPDGFVANVKIGDSDLLVMSGESLRGQE